MSIQLLIVTAFFALVSSNQASSYSRFLSGATLSNGTRIFLPADPAVEQRWDIFSPPSYSLAIRPADVQDLQVIVRLASELEIPLLATGGGHGTSGTLEGIMNGLEVDLGNFNSVTLDSQINTLTVGGGTKFSGVISLLYGAGKEVPIVASDCIGMLGSTLGGGVGILQGIHGLLLDSLLSVELVTASGALVTASDEVNPELFWGLRGAGHNFGIVTSATYKVHDSTNEGMVINADFLFTAAQNRSIWELMASLDDDLPPYLALTFFASPDPRVQNSFEVPPIILVNAVYFGPRDEAMLHLAPLLALQPGMSNISTILFSDVLNAAFFGQDATSGGCEKGNNVNIYSLALNQTDVATWEAHFNELADFYVKYPGYKGRLLVQRYSNQAALAVVDSATAYPLREAKIHVNMEGWYTNRSLDGPVNEFLSSSRAKFQATSGFPELSVYVNYARGDEGPRGWYSSRKLERLNAIKEQWDPQRLFSWNNPISRALGS